MFFPNNFLTALKVIKRILILILGSASWIIYEVCEDLLHLRSSVFYGGLWMIALKKVRHGTEWLLYFKFLIVIVIIIVFKD